MRAPLHLVVLIIEKTSDKESNALDSSPGFIMICVMLALGFSSFSPGKMG